MRASGDITYINSVLTTTIKGLTSIELDKEAKAIYGVKDGDYAFYNCKDTLQSFIIPEGSQLEVIQPYSFYKCTKLEQIDLSFCSSLTLIGDYSFYGCSSLRSVNFPESLISINSNGFKNTALEAVFIPKNVKNIGTYVFHSISKLKTCTFDENSKITEISSGLFAFSGIISFTVPRYVSKFSTNAFEGAQSLIEFKVQEGNENFIAFEKVLYNKNTYELVKYPAGLTGILKLHQNCKKIGYVSCDFSKITTIEFSSVIEIIDSYSFQHSKIEKLIMPNTINSIGVQAFSGCSNLYEITISNQIKALSDGCFAGTKIETIVIPNGITKIGTRCFSGCKSLKEIQLPNSTTNIGGGVFADCQSINVTFEEGSQFFISSDFYLMDNEQEGLIQYLGSLTELQIPSTIKVIKNNAFINQKTITQIDFLSDDTVTEIQEAAFSNCELLKIINLPNSITTIGNKAFENCKSLESINFSSKLTSIGNNCFAECLGLKEVTFETVDELIIGNSCFSECSSLQNIKLPEGLISIGSQCFYQCTNLKNVEIPSTLSNWSEKAFSYSGLISFDFPSEFQITVIPYQLFYSSSNLERVSLGLYIEKIEAEAFALTALHEIHIPENVKSIGNSCFAGCKSLTLFYVPSSESNLQIIGDYLFDDSILLSNITCNNKYFSSDRGVLYNSDKTKLVLCPPASSIKYYSIPNTVKTISNSAFYKCKNILHILIPDDSVETIGVNAFSYCSELLTINIPSCVKTIHSDAFLGCTRLRCGLTIDDPSINSQLIESKIPVRCILKCPNTINQNCKSYLHVYILLYPAFY